MLGFRPTYILLTPETQTKQKRVRCKQCKTKWCWKSIGHSLQPLGTPLRAHVYNIYIYICIHKHESRLIQYIRCYNLEHALKTRTLTQV